MGHFMETSRVSFPQSPPPVFQAGDLLIADPSLNSGIFRKSVVLLADHTSNGAFGLILNSPSNTCVGDYLRDKNFASLARIPVHTGGPVAREHLTFAAFWMSPDNELRYAFRISAEDAIQHSKNTGTLVRAFVGYSGWGRGQLESELESHSWVLTSPPANLLGMPHDRSLWRETLEGLSAFHRLLTLCPQNPWLN